MVELNQKKNPPRGRKIEEVAKKEEGNPRKARRKISVKPKRKIANVIVTAYFTYVSEFFSPGGAGKLLIKAECRLV